MLKNGTVGVMLDKTLELRTIDLNEVVDLSL